MKELLYKIEPFERVAITEVIVSAPFIMPTADKIKHHTFEARWNTASPVCRISDSFGRALKLKVIADDPAPVYRGSLILPVRNLIPSQKHDNLLIFAQTIFYGGQELEGDPVWIGGDVIYQGTFVTGQMPNFSYVQFRVPPTNPSHLISGYSEN